MQKTLLRTFLVVIASVLASASAAYALKFELDEMVVSATAQIEPRELPGPGSGNKPVNLSTVVRVSAKDGSAPLGLTQILLKIDKHGTIDAQGLAVCTLAKLAGTTPDAARKRCAGAIVGKGSGKADVRLPGRAPTQIQSPLTFFNGPPQGGKPTLIAHAWETLPVPQAVLVPFTVERIKNGRYGYQVEINLPQIAAGYGSATLAEATVGKTWKRGGKQVGYIDAHCLGGRLQVYGKLSFADGSVLPGILASPCHEPR
jgi:hypothetical protein